MCSDFASMQAAIAGTCEHLWSLAGDLLGFPRA